MIILAFETSHAEASVALLVGDTIHEKKIHSSLKHEETVMPAATALLEEHSLSVSKVDTVAVDIGPGSFTGIRIGACHANAIADALGIPCIGICSLKAMAFAKAIPDCTAVMIDAGNENCYGAIYDAEMKEIYGPVADQTSDFLKRAEAYKCKKIIQDSPENLPTASIIARAAENLYNTAVDDKIRAMPFYLRPSQAERKRKA